MGQKFMARAEFAAAIDRIATVTGRPLQEMISGWSDGELLPTDQAQIAIFAVSTGIAACLRAVGAAPELVAGHSLGHFSALQASGALSLEDAAQLVDARGRFMRGGGDRVEGGMGVVQGLAAPEVAGILAESALPVWPANLNLADQTVVSGRRDALPEARERIVAAGGRWVALNVSGAFHSPLLAEEAQAFAQLIQAVTILEPKVPVLANGTGVPLLTADAIRIDLVGHMTGQVVWTSVMDRLSAQPDPRIVEVGPGKVLTGLLLRHAPGLRPMPTSLPPLLDRVCLALTADISEELAA